MAYDPKECPSPIDFAPTYEDLLREHPEVVQGQAYEQEKNSNPGGAYTKSAEKEM